MLKGLKTGAGLLHKAGPASANGARNFSFTVNGAQATAGEFCTLIRLRQMSNHKMTTKWPLYKQR